MSDTPSITEAIRAVIDSELAETYTIVPGKLQSWDRATGSGNVIPLVRLADGTTLPVVVTVPVIFPVAYQDLDITHEQAFGLLLVCTLDWRRWWRGGDISAPETVARHALSNAVFLPGLRGLQSARAIPANSAVLEKPVAGGYVRLGEALAFKAAVHEDLLGDLDTLLAALDTWGGLVQVATGVAWAGPQVPLLALRAGIAAGTYQSPSVMVED